MNDLDHMNELRQQGFYCSQILMLLGLELQGKENPDVIRATNALAGGLGFTGEATCGALTGAASLLGLYAGKSKPKEMENPRLNFMIETLVKWFKSGYAQEYGGMRCHEIIGDSGQFMAARCPVIVAGTYQKVKDLLVEYGFDLAGSDNDDR